MRIALFNGKFGFCETILGEYTIHNSNSSSNFEIHRSNLENVLRKHVFETQKFNTNPKKLWAQIKPKLNLMDFKNDFNHNFFFSLKKLITQIFKNPVFHFIYIKNIMINKIKG